MACKCGSGGAIIVRPELAESEFSVLCDATGHAFLRRYSIDAGVVSTVDTELDGTTPYAPVDPVGVCGAVDPEESPGELDPVCGTTVQTLPLCDLDPAATPDENGNICPTRFLRHLAYDCTGALLAATWDTTLDGTTLYDVVGSVDDCSASGSALVTVPWEVVAVEPDPGGVAGQDFLFRVAPVDGSMPQGIVLVHTTINDTAAPCPGSMSFPRTTVFTATLDGAAQAMDFLRIKLRDFDTTESITPTITPSRAGGNAYIDGPVVRSNTDNQAGWIDFENPPASFSWTFDDPVRSGACIILDLAGGHRAGGCCGDCGTDREAAAGVSESVLERCRCDDTDGDGIGDVDYVELWAVDPTPGRRPTLIGSFTPDLGSTYDPVNPVDCAPDGDEVVGAQARRVVLGTGDAWNALFFPLLRSVSVLVRAGTANVTDQAGATTMVTGETASWDAPDDGLLSGPLIISGATADADVVVNYTIAVTA